MATQDDAVKQWFDAMQKSMQNSPEGRQALQEAARQAMLPEPMAAAPNPAPWPRELLDLSALRPPVPQAISREQSERLTESGRWILDRGGQRTLGPDEYGRLQAEYQEMLRGKQVEMARRQTESKGGRQERATRRFGMLQRLQQGVDRREWSAEAAWKAAFCLKNGQGRSLRSTLKYGDGDVGGFPTTEDPLGLDAMPYDAGQGFEDNWDQPISLNGSRFTEAGADTTLSVAINQFANTGRIPAPPFPGPPRVGIDVPAPPPPVVVPGSGVPQWSADGRLGEVPDLDDDVLDELSEMAEIAYPRKGETVAMQEVVTVLACAPKILEELKHLRSIMEKVLYIEPCHDVVHLLSHAIGGVCEVQRGDIGLRLLVAVFGKDFDAAVIPRRLHKRCKECKADIWQDWLLRGAFTMPTVKMTLKTNDPGKQDTPLWNDREPDFVVAPDGRLVPWSEVPTTKLFDRATLEAFDRAEFDRAESEADDADEG